jgi:hypothetical protein
MRRAIRKTVHVKVAQDEKVIMEIPGMQMNPQGCHYSTIDLGVQPRILEEVLDKKVFYSAKLGALFLCYHLTGCFFSLINKNLCSPKENCATYENSPSNSKFLLKLDFNACHNALSYFRLAFLKVRGLLYIYHFRSNVHLLSINQSSRKLGHVLTILHENNFLFSGSTYREETEEQISLNPEPKKSSKHGKKKRDKSKRRGSSRKEEKED